MELRQIENLQCSKCLKEAVNALRDGNQLKAFEILLKLGLVHPRQLQAFAYGNKENMLHVIEAYALASEVLEGESKALSWLRTQNGVLKAAPIEILARDDDGLKRVSEVLHQIDYGVIT